jgi:CheY-like chemotaxis protein
MDGWAAIRELQSRAMTATIPVIVLTGHDFKAYLKPAALAVGAVSYVTKPCLPDQLAREISARLTARRSRGELPADLRPGR